MLEEYATNHSPASVNRLHSALSAVLSYAVRKKWLSKNVAREISKRTEPKGRKRFLSDDERERLLDACRRSEWPGLIVVVSLALSTGARKSEIKNLRWRDVDLRRGPAEIDDAKRRVNSLCKGPVDPKAQQEARDQLIKAEWCEFKRAELEAALRPQAHSPSSEIESLQGDVDYYCN